MGEDSSQYGFMRELFAKIVCEPFSEEDIDSDENDDYYPFSALCGESQAKKVYKGERMLPKALARFVVSHYSPSKLIEYIDDMGDFVKENLCKALVKEGITCHIDNVGDIVADILYRFIEVAIDENDTIDTGIKVQTVINIEDDTVVNRDILLLDEVSNLCPLCRRKLLLSNGKNIVKKYSVVQIFPDNLSRDDYLTFNKIHSIKDQYDSPDNRIPLCSDCALAYRNEITIDKFKQLVEIKRIFVKRQKLQQSISNINLEDSIQEIINGLIAVTLDTQFLPLDMRAVRIGKKIPSSKVILKNTICDDVVHYYKYIENLFKLADEKKTNTFNTIATEVKLVFEKIESSGLLQEDMFDEMVNWLLQKTGLDARHTMPARIIISFFVQNCEVFHEISK